MFSNFRMTVTLLFVLMISPSLAQEFSKKLANYTNDLSASIDQVDEERTESLKEIGDYVLEELKMDQKANLLVICTHNSRRSHIGQLWLQTAAMYYGVEGINAFSGGTEATAFNSNAVEALERAGFSVSKGMGDNPKYEVTAGNRTWIHYSKKYMDKQNPSEDFGAIMVCSDADKSCPIVKGAEARFSLPYNDPRYADGTPSQNAAYDKTVQEIGQEVFYLMSYVKNKQVELLEASK